MIRQIRRDLDGDDGEQEDDDEQGEVGRRRFGAASGKMLTTALDTSKRTSRRQLAEEGGLNLSNITNNAQPNITSNNTTTARSTAGAWSSGEVRRRGKKSSSTAGGALIEDLNLNSSVIAAPRPRTKSSSNVTDAASKLSRVAGADADADAESDADSDNHLPLAIRDQALVARAFAGEDVVGDFLREKEEVAEADEDKVVDNTLPGWGSWVGDGVSAKEKNRHNGRYLTKIKGVKKNDRKDARLDKVIINEKRVKKVSLAVYARILAYTMP